MSRESFLHIVFCCGVLLTVCTGCPPAPYCNCSRYATYCSLRYFPGSISALLELSPDGLGSPQVYFREIDTTLSMEDTAAMAIYFGNNSDIGLEFVGTSLTIAADVLENLSNTRVTNLRFELQHLEIIKSNINTVIPSLRSLVLSNVSEIVGLGDLFSQVSNLQRLFIYTENILQKDYTVLSALTNLLELNIQFTDLAVFPAFPLLPNITFLSLESNKIHSVSGDVLSSFPNISALYLSYNHMELFNPPLCEHLKGLAQLRNKSLIELDIVVEKNQLRNLDECLIDFRLCSLPSEKQVKVNFYAEGNCLCEYHNISGHNKDRCSEHGHCVATNNLNNHHRMIFHNLPNSICNCSTPTSPTQGTGPVTSTQPITMTEIRSSNQPVIGLIVGVSLGAVIIGALLIVWCCHNQRSQRQYRASGSRASTEAAHVIMNLTSETLHMETMAEAETVVTGP